MKPLISSKPGMLLPRTLALLLILTGCPRPVQVPSPEPQGTVIDADHPLIRYTGRFDFTDPKAPSFEMADQFMPVLSSVLGWEKQ